MQMSYNNYWRRLHYVRYNAQCLIGSDIVPSVVISSFESPSEIIPLLLDGRQFKSYIVGYYKKYELLSALFAL